MLTDALYLLQSTSRYVTGRPNPKKFWFSNKAREPVRPQEHELLYFSVSFALLTVAIKLFPPLYKHFLTYMSHHLKF